MSNDLLHSKTPLKSETADCRRLARRQRVRKVLRYLQILGLPASGGGVLGTLLLIKNGQYQLAAIVGGVSILAVFLAVSGKFLKDLVERILDKIEERLEKRADFLAEWVVNRLENWCVKFWWKITSKFQGKYYQRLIYQCRDYRTQGLKIKGSVTLELEKIFVPLQIAPESFHNISANILRFQRKEKEKSIWEILVASTRYHTYRSIAIIGAPGSGKTTLLEHLTLIYAQNLQRRKFPNAPKFIPILLYLRLVREIITKKQPSLAELLEQYPEIKKRNPPDRWFEETLQTKQCLVMLDGLDEVASDKQRIAVSNWVNQQIQDYPKAIFLVTSRPFGYRTAPIENIKTILEVQPFNLAQVRQFIENWYVQNEIRSRLGQDDLGVREIAQKQADDLCDRIQNSAAIASMSINPLLLTMIATVHCYRGALPGRRVELYNEICDVLLGRRQEAKGIPSSLTAEQKKTVLQVLALELMQRKTREFTLEFGETLIHEKLETVTGTPILPIDFLKHIQKGSGLVVEKERNIYEFAHKSFQEYLAAVQIRESNQDFILEREMQDSWWEETIRLYSARGDASNIILAALSNSNIWSLKLALDCEEESLQVQPEVRKKLRKKLEEGLESNNLEIFKLAVSVKLIRRLSKLKRIDENRKIDNDYITRTEYRFCNQKSIVLSKNARQIYTSNSYRDGMLFCGFISQIVSIFERKSQNVLSLDEELYYYRLPTFQENKEHTIKTENSNLSSWVMEDSIENKIIEKNKAIRIVWNRVPELYVDLVKSLLSKDWKQADRETATLMLKIANREDIGWLDEESILEFPDESLLAIDRFWLLYSGLQFGFSLQKEIFEDLDTLEKSEAEKWKSFSKKVGWFSRWKPVLNTSIDAPIGHFPYSISALLLPSIVLKLNYCQSNV